MELSAEQTATQLHCLHGKAGMASGQAMNLHNLAQIISAFAAARLQNGDNILETDCDNGDLSGCILSQANGLHYAGLEISSLMHEQAQTFNASFVAAEQADCRLYDGDALPLTDAAFHKTVSVNTVYFWDDAPFMLAEPCHVLEFGGRLRLNFYEKDFIAKLPFMAYNFMLYDVADIRALAENLPLRCTSEQHSRDWAVSKSGKLVRREFVDLVSEHV